MMMLTGGDDDDGSNIGKSLLTSRMTDLTLSTCARTIYGLGLNSDECVYNHDSIISSPTQLGTGASRKRLYAKYNLVGHIFILNIFFVYLRQHHLYSTTCKGALSFWLEALAGGVGWWCCHCFNV